MPHIERPTEPTAHHRYTPRCSGLEPESAASTSVQNTATAFQMVSRRRRRKATPIGTPTATAHAGSWLVGTGVSLHDSAAVHAAAGSSARPPIQPSARRSVLSLSELRALR